MFLSNKIKKYLIFASAIIILLVGFSSVSAQDLGLNEAGNIGLLASATSDPRMLLVNIVRFILGFLGIVATIIVLYGGWLWMTSAGEIARVEKAKKTLIAAVIGLIIIIAAFAIVTFVANFIQSVIENSTGGTGCTAPTPYSCPSGCSATPCGSITPTADSFRLRSTSPRADANNQPRNVVVRAFLSDSAAPSVDAVLDNNFRVERLGDIDPATGNFTAGATTPITGVVSTSFNRTILNFRASTNFDAWSRFRVTINGASGIVDNSNRSLECGIPGTASCVFNFDTNDLIDTATPTVGIIPTQICHDDGTLQPDANIIGGWGRDDTGISFLRSYYGSPAVYIFQIPGTGARYQYAESQVDTTAMTVGSAYTFTAEVDDLVLNTEAASFDATVRAGHCCNGVQDTDEEEADCGGTECDSCASMNPIITNLSPDNGAPGNFITIMGRHFGSTQGRVYFSDAAGNMTVEASFPDPVDCPNNWSDNQIIVVVPGAQTGPIRIVRADGREDTTAADSQPQIDFTVNTTVRPGLCLADPASAYFNDNFALHGVSFGTANHYVRFGSAADYITANNMHDWSDILVRAQVPNISRGRNTVYVSVNTENSNPLYFTVQQDTNNNPIIDYIDPGQGPNNQYITIYGSGFMNYQSGISEVTFTNFGTSAVAPAGIDFPEQCRDGWWHTRYITVKVPDGVAAGLYQIRVTNRAANTSDPEDFNVTSGEPTPGICILDPHNGPVSTAVNIYGDNMGDAPGAVRFYNNIAVTPPNSDWEARHLTTAVPAGAETGPVVVTNGGATSNSLPFTVGSCTSNDDCELGVEECCGSNSPWSGICRATSTCAGAAFAPTAFGWTFSTAVTAEPGADCSNGSTCNGTYPACADPTNYFCDPTSGCTCQPRSDTTDSCQGRSERTNRCDPLACPNSPGACSPYTATGEQVLEGITCDDTCASVANCTTGNCNFIASLDTCVLTDRFCTQTEYDLFGREVTATCETYGTGGEYYWQIVTTASCPSGWVSAGNGRCVNLAETCEPCPSNFNCRDYDNNGQGECISRQRMCTGTSHCVGTECRVADQNSCECCCRIGQDAQDCCVPLTCEGNCGSDASGTDTNTYGYCSGCAAATNPDGACNCEGHEGKFCDTSTNATGVCRDCAALNSTECANHDSCCVDPKQNNECRGIGTDGVRNGDGTCAYFACEISGGAADCIADNTGNYKTMAECSGQCVGPDDAPIGQRCQNLSPVYSCTTGLASCGVYNCISNDLGSNCRCCCDPNNNTCPSGLDCLPNEPCDSPAGNRGLCCGCNSNSQCYGGDFQGCGIDTCCHERPQVSAVLPTNEEDGVCRNTIVRVNFNQKMSIPSFTGNIVLLGDYGDSTCPAGTTYLALEAPHQNKFVQFIDNIKRSFRKILAIVWPQQTALAQFNPEPGHSYCAVQGITTGYNDTTDNGVMEFRLSSALDANTVYFAIVRGDRNLDNQQGVLNAWEIGMNDVTYDGQPEMLTFNGVAYSSSYVWAFRTGAEICELDNVVIDPASYLFITPNTGVTFTAEPRAANGQVIGSIPGVYEWNWSWRSSKSSAAIVTNTGAPDPTQTVTSQNVQDDRTVVSATASIVGQTYSRTGQANVYVFLCENPWPVRNVDGSWAPWRDQAGNCIPGSGDCANSYNYELYYCRDSGNTGTFDDLPPLLGTDSTPPIIRGQSDSALKEAYFFRENVPTATTSLTITDDGTGNSVTANWVAVPEPGLTNYRLYWGTASGNYSNHQELSSTVNTYTVTGLANRTTYYFRLTAIYSNNRVETNLYNEISLTPRDRTAPNVPANLTAATTTTSGEISLQWNAVNDAASYNVYYGASPSAYGSARNVGRTTAVILSGLRSNNSYYFLATAVDASGNESSTSTAPVGPFSPSP